MADIPSSLTLEVATPLGLALKTEASSVTAPSVDGEFGVLPGHLPLLAALKPGVIRYSVGKEEKAAAVGSGFVEAGPRRVLLLTEKFASSETIDPAGAAAEASKAEDRLRTFTGEYDSPEYEKLKQDLGWATARVEAAQRSGHS